MNHAITIVIPAFNEEDGIVQVITDLKAVLAKDNITHEIIVVDDGSADDTINQAKSTGVTVIEHLKNRGYGASLKTGIHHAQYELIVITDADNTYPPEYIPEMLKYIDEADMVVGSRKGEKVEIPLVRRPAKWMLRKLASYVTSETIPDLNSGLRILHRDLILQYVNILSDRFSFTTTSTVALLSDGYKIKYIPINYHHRSGKSKIVPWNFVEFVNLVIRLSMLFNPLKIFLPASFITLGLAFVKFIFDIAMAIQEAGGLTLTFWTTKVISSSVLVLGFSGLQILLIGMMADGINRKIAQYSAPKVQSRYRQSFKIHNAGNAENAV